MKRGLLVLLVLAATVVAIALQRPERPPNSEEEIAFKRAHFAAVVAELAAAPTGHLTPVQAKRRAAVLEHLRDYAERAEFPHNTKAPGYALPYFIDAYGTRCALAYAIDRGGDGDLVLDLAARDNHAFVAHLQDEPRLAGWLDRHGLTLDDAAFVQVPSNIGRGELPPRPIEEEEESEEPPAPEPEPEDDAPGAGTPNAPPPTNGRRGVTRRGRGGVDLGSWELFWTVNRDAYISLRRLYHDGPPTSGTKAGDGRRPSRAVLSTKLLPLVQTLSRGEGELRASAIMAAALAMQAPADAKPVVAAARVYLRDPGSRYRDLLLLALGVVKDAEATALLLAIARDERDGRDALGRRSRIPERTRAFAAVALSRTEDGGVVEPLRELLEGLEGREEDLRASIVTTLGVLLPRAKPAAKEAAVHLLRRELKRERWPLRSLTAIPAALLRSGDADARKDLLRRVARFRGERELRSSASLAFGTFGPAGDERVIDALIASARRDPDLQTRRHAAIALGEIALRDGREQAPETLRAKLRRFYLGTLDGYFKQPGAYEWHYLSAGMFARRFPGDAEKILKRLEREAVDGRKRGERSAAVLALGLSGSVEARKPLRGILESAKDVQLRGSAAEALGMLGDRASRDRLLELATGASSDSLRYRSALALGYLADGTVVPKLVEALENTSSEPTRAALTAVLGQLGDRRALDDLARIAADDGKPRAVRERALGALGLLGRDADASWTLPLRRGVNIPFATPALRQVLFIF